MPDSINNNTPQPQPQPSTPKVSRGRVVQEWILYILFAVALWGMLTLAVGFEFRVSEWLDTLPLLFGMSLVYAILFAFLFFGLLWASEKIFIAMVVVLLTLEIFIFRNSLLYTYPQFFVAAPLSLLLYSAFTFLPLWIVERSFRQHKRSLIAMAIAFVLVLLFNYVALPLA